jgi:uncharacterized protein
MNLAFEFDEAKSAANKNKHGIDFVEAQRLWATGSEVVIPARPLENELRMAMIGKLDEKHWVAVYTLRNETIRLISVRRARIKEKEYYESF